MIARAPTWATSLVVLSLCAVAALLSHQAAVILVRRLMAGRDPFWWPLVRRTRRPTRLAALIVGLMIGAGLAPLTVGQADLLRRLLLIGLIALIGWVALTALDIWASLYSRKLRLDVEDNLVARKHLTQVRILKRTAAGFVVLLTVAFALMTFSGVRQYGVSLLASAGAASIIAGLALQPLLTNLLAGIQIAVTQPIRLDDAVVVENEWGWIEEINATYVVVRLWDWRRLILPLTYFIQKPFQNWTRDNASLIGTTMLHVDYAADVPLLRAKLEAIAAASPLWDRQVVNLAVTEATERTLQIRCLISARNAPAAFDLRCEVREKMIAFLQAEHPRMLPRDRLDLRTGREDDAATP